MLDQGQDPPLDYAIHFHWAGGAPTKEQANAFIEEATDSLIDIAEKHGCFLGDGLESQNTKGIPR